MPLLHVTTAVPHAFRGLSGTRGRHLYAANKLSVGRAAPKVATHHHADQGPPGAHLSPTSDRVSTPSEFRCFLQDKSAPALGRVHLDGGSSSLPLGRLRIPSPLAGGVSLLPVRCGRQSTYEVRMIGSRIP